MTVHDWSFKDFTLFCTSTPFNSAHCRASHVWSLCDWGCRCFCIVIELQLRSGPCHDNVPNLALLLKSWINACFKSLTWSAIQTCTGLTGLPWLPVISCRVLQAHYPAGENYSTISACVSPSCVHKCTVGLGNASILYCYCDIRLDIVLDFVQHYIVIRYKCCLFLILEPTLH